MVVVSPPTLTDSDPPIRAASSEICAAVLVVVPSRIRSPVRSASQTSSAFSKALPVRMLSVTRTFGMVPHCTSATWRPLSRVNRFGSGTLKSRGTPGFGGSAGNGASGFARGFLGAGFWVAASARACPRGLLRRRLLVDGFSRSGSQAAAPEGRRVPPGARRRSITETKRVRVMSVPFPFGVMVRIVRLVGRRYSRAAFWISSGVTLRNSSSSRLIFAGSSSNSANAASRLARPKPTNCS